MVDVCKHCSSAACLEVCPTGRCSAPSSAPWSSSPDICNGCGYCVPACPFEVIDRREDDGRAFKCTLCYDRLHDGLEPACATACPTNSIQFGELDELQARAEQYRVATLREAERWKRPGCTWRTPTTASAAPARSSCCWTSGGVRPAARPVSTTRDLPTLWRAAALAAGTLAAAVATAFLGGRR